MSTSLVTARRALGHLVGHYGVFTASGGSTSTLVCANAFQSSSLPTDALAYAWVYVPSITASAARQRRVTKTGLDGSTGTITVDAAFASAVANGTVFEVSGRLPCVGETGATQGNAMVRGLGDCLNLGLRHLLLEDDSATITLVSGQRDYDISAVYGLDRTARLADVRQLDAAGSAYVSTWRTWEIREGAANGPVLHFTEPFRFPSGTYTAKLVALRPGDQFIKVGGSWATSNVGLVSESDEANCDVNTIVTVALVFAYRALRDARQGPAKARYQSLYETQLQEARRLRQYDHTNDIDPTVPGAREATAEAA